MADKQYNIAFVGLALGSHSFEYTVTDKFFEAFQQQEYTNTEILVKLILEKNIGFMQLNFVVTGTVRTNCDRCGNEIDTNIWDEFKLIIKLVENPQQMNDTEEDPDIYYLLRTESLLNVKDWIYEFVNLSIPTQNVCVDNDKGESQCNPKVIAMLQQLNVTNNDNTPSIWKGLDKFKNIEN